MMNSHNDSNLTNSSSDASLTQDYSPELSSSATIFRYDIIPYTGILIPHDGRDLRKAFSHAIYLSKYLE